MNLMSARFRPSPALPCRSPGSPGLAPKVSSSAWLAELLVQDVDLCPRISPELALDELSLPSVLESPFF